MATEGVLSVEETDQIERSSKKVKTQDVLNHDSEMVTEGDDSELQLINGDQKAVGFVSFRDKLTGNVPEQNSAMSMSASEDEVEDDEVEEGSSDSDASSEGDDDGSPFVPCPKLKFTQEELDEWCRPRKLTLIVHLMGRTGFFAVSFTNQNDFVYAYQEGPWMVADHYLVVQRCRPNFNPKDANEVTKIAAWVRVPSLPLEFYNARCLWRIGDLVGRTLKIDPTTSLTSRGKFARICIEINLKKQLVPQVEVRGRCYAVEYEGLHMVCFHCGRYGHTRDLCMLKKEAEGMEKSQQVDLNEVPNDGEQGRDNGDEAAPGMVQGAVRQEDNNGNDGIFGPWMVVSRSKRGKNFIPKRNGFNGGGAKVNHGGMDKRKGGNEPRSRFDVLKNVGEQMENPLGSGINEVVLQGWSTDPNESSFSRKINGKEVIEDRAPWKPNVVQSHPPALTLVQTVTGNSRKPNVSNRDIALRPRSSSGPKRGSNGPSSFMMPISSSGENIGSSRYMGSQGLVSQDGVGPFQLTETHSSTLLHSQPREPPNRGPQQRALRGREGKTEANGGVSTHGGASTHGGVSTHGGTSTHGGALMHGGRHGVGASVSGLEAPASRMDVENCRGTASKSFPGLIRDLKRNFKVDFLALVETHQEGVNAQRIVDKLGFTHHVMVDAVGYSGGIWCMWNECGCQFRVVQKHAQFIHFNVLEGSRRWFLTIVYGSPRVAPRRELWNKLNSIGASMGDPWCIVGDFNAFLFYSEKIGGSSLGSRPDRHFLNMVDINSLVDLGYTGPNFTWQRGSVAVRLDRALANLGWRYMFPEASVMHLPRLKSEHSPILVRLHSVNDLGVERNRPFRFLASWLLHDNFHNVVKDSWQSDWYGSLNCFQEKIKVWNREVFGNIFRKKDKLLRRIPAKSVASAIPVYSMQMTVLPSRVCEEVEKRSRAFIWRDNDSSKKIHLVSWSAMCRTKQYGGLGLRHVREQNKAFMVKLGWGLTNQKDALWARVLRAKYKCGDDLIPVIDRNNSASRLWKGIADAWKYVQDGLVWRLGDGKKVRFWSDPWLPNGKALCTYALGPLSTSDLAMVAADFVSPSGAWSGLDLISCILVRDDNFSTKSAYHAITSVDGGERIDFWKLLWKWKGMEKIRSFLWLCGHDRLLTNVARKRRGMAATDICSRCNGAPEDLLHTLRDCPKAKCIWLKLLGFSGNDWDVIFANACWFIWRMRNAEIFDDSRDRYVDPVIAILKLSSDSIRAMDKSIVGGSRHCPSVNRFICWNKHEKGWVKFNVDGVRKDSLSLTACGGLARDSEGRFLTGFVHKLGDGTALNAELWSMLSALEVAWRAGFKKIVVESDCLTAVKLVNDSVQAMHPCSTILSQIHHWVAFDWEIKFVHVHREGNFAADALATFAFSWPLGLNALNDAPAFLHQFLLADIEGRGCLRLCGG
ncbi:putative ribonuclease H protein At1g65750 family [Senna tora]|uniref:Putative ribonuclease H protein At1g65750 family n=1 Tax=Senna tora TaxID=362788 RepID=A0A834T454_9FABA|nr:putative ribonuclease H protein At1g65750 family [Senna tora]